jgi:hypothetical protein
LRDWGTQPECEIATLFVAECQRRIYIHGRRSGDSVHVVVEFCQRLHVDREYKSRHSIPCREGTELVQEESRRPTFPQVENAECVRELGWFGWERGRQKVKRRQRRDVARDVTRVRALRRLQRREGREVANEESGVGKMRRNLVVVKRINGQKPLTRQIHKNPTRFRKE